MLSLRRSTRQRYQLSPRSYQVNIIYRDAMPVREYVYSIGERMTYFRIHLGHHTWRGSIFSEHGEDIGSDLRGHNNGIILSHWVRNMSSGEDLRGIPGQYRDRVALPVFLV
jgi:hypothetical protein